MIIASPYFIPGPMGMGMMRMQVERGVRVMVVTNSLGSTDEPLAYAGYERYRARLVKAGRRDLRDCAHLHPAATGASAISASRSAGCMPRLAMVDDAALFVGSMNLDHRSAAVNTELGPGVDSPALAADFARIISADGFASAYQVRLGPTGSVEWVERDRSGQVIKVHTDEPETNWLVQVKNWLLSPWVLEELL